MNKNIIKIIIFIFILIILIYFIFKILWVVPTSISFFYDEPENSLDIVYIGSSTVYRSFNTVLTYNLYGYTTGILSASSQPFVLTEYLIKESEKYQKPYLYVVDITRLVSNPEEDTEGNIRKTIDNMKFSKNRIEAINSTLEFENINNKDRINWYFSFLMYHNKWKNISNENIIGERTLYKGYSFSKDTVIKQPINKYIWKENVMHLQEKNNEILNSLLDYITLNKLNVLFIIPKKNFSEEDNARLNYAIEILQKNKMNVINCNTIPELNNIDYNTDFYDIDHLNVYGATKYTLYLSEYLKQNYNLKNHKDDVKYNSWNEEYERFKLNFKKITNKDFNDFISLYKKYGN